MPIPIDTIVFFEIALAGFIAVRTFRYFSENKEKYSEFEWLGLSAFSGLFIIMTMGGIIQTYPGGIAELNKLLVNPFATGAIMSSFGFIFGYVASRIIRFKIWSWLMEYIGKNGKQDRSDRLWK